MDSRKNVKSLFELCLITILMFTTSCSRLPDTQQRDIYFVSRGYRVPGSAKIYPTCIYRFNRDSLSLEETWCATPNSIGNGTIHLQTDSILLISLGENAIRSVQLFDPSNPEKNISIDLSSYGYISRCSWLSRGPLKGDLMFEQLVINDPKKFRDTLVFECNFRTGSLRKVNRAPTGTHHITGSWNDIFGDVVRMTILPNGKWFVYPGSNSVELPTLPDSLARKWSGADWFLVTHSPEFDALVSVKIAKPNETDRTLMIFKNNTNSWHQMKVDRGALKFSTINRWLVGTVEKDPPKDKPHSPKIQTERCIFVDPMNQAQFEVSLGKLHKVLWISNDSMVYYRNLDTLFIAEITQSGLSNREMLLKEPKVHVLDRGYEVVRDSEN